MPCDVQVILQIPICLRDVDDFWSWHYENSENFNVRSAYKIVVETKKRREEWLEQRAGSSNNSANKKAWLEDPSTSKNKGVSMAPSSTVPAHGGHQDALEYGD